MNTMKRLLALLILFPLLALGANRETATVTVTNIPVVGETLVINGTTKTWATVATNSTYIATGASIGASTTNLWTHYSTYQPAGPVVVSMTATNIVTLTGAIGQTLTVTRTTNWCALTFTTNAFVSAVNIRVPFSVEAATNRTNNANQLISDLGVNATTAAGATVPWLANYASLSQPQTITGAKTMTGANVFGGGTITNVSLGTITLPYRTDASGIQLFDSSDDPQVAIGPDDTGIPTMWDISAGYGLTNQSGAFSSMTDGNVLNKASGDYYYGRFDGTNTWTGANTFSHASGITSSIITNSTISGTISLLKNGTITNSTLRNVKAYNQFWLGGSALTSSSGTLNLARSVSEQVVDGVNSAYPTGENVLIQEIGNGGTPPTAPYSISGLADGYPGKTVFWFSDTYSATFLNQSGIETVATNRIVTGTSGDVGGVQAAIFVYEDSSARWRMIAANRPTISPAYGQISTHDNTTNQILTLAGTYYKLTNFDTIPESSGTTCSWTGDQIRVDSAGTYFVTVTASFSGTTNETFDGAIHTNLVEASHIEFQRKLGAAGDIGAASASGIVTLPAAAIIDFRMKAVGAGSGLVLRDGQLTVHRIN